MLEAITADFLLLNFVGLASIALGIWIFTLDPGSRLNQVFALVLMARGTAPVLGPMSRQIDDLTVASAMQAFLPYVTLATFPLIAYFLSIYPHRRGLIGTTRWGPWALLAVTIGGLVWYGIDHSIYGTAVMVRKGTLAYDDGALLFLYGLRSPLMGLVGLVLAIDYLRRPNGSQGYSLFLLSAAFALGAIFTGTQFVTQTALEAQSEPAGNLLATPFGRSILAQTLALPVGLAALVPMGLAMRHRRDDRTLQEAHRFVTIFAPAALVLGALAGAFHHGDDGGSALANGRTLYFIMGLWGLVMPLLITYSLLRFSLFDVDVRLKAGVRRAIILGAFAVTFFIVSEAAEAVFAGGRGPVFGVLAAALLAGAARPLQMVAQKAADKLMPDTIPLHMLSPRSREELYRDQFVLVGGDGQVTTKERRMLDDLADALLLNAKQTARLETGGRVRGSTKTPPATGTPAAPAPSARRSIIVALAAAVVLGALSATLEFLVPVSDFTVGLLSAAAITVLLGPIERLAMRLAGEQAPRVDARSISLFEKELAHAVSDGDWSRRDRRYLNGLAGHLGIDGETRRKLTRRALSAKGLRSRAWRAAGI